MRSHNRIYVNGGWVSSTDRGAIPVYDSTDGTVMGSVPAGSAMDVDRAVAAARTAFDSWSGLSPEERAKYCARIAEALADREDEIADVVTRETGMPLWLSRQLQARTSVEDFVVAAELGESFPEEQRLGNSVVLREPIGVVGCITPWNYPLHQIAAKVAYAIAAGCTVVVKPSEVAPLDAFILAEVVAEVGLPAGVFNLVTGGSEVGEALASHPGIDMISFTGSTRAGKQVSVSAAQTVKRVALELGGKSANILLDDLDAETFERAVRHGVLRCYVNSGQTCLALSRMLVPRRRLAEAEAIAADEATGRFKPGDPFADGVWLGPLASQAHAERVTAYVQTGIDEGAKLVAGGVDRPVGLGDGYFVHPTVFSDVGPDMTIAQEEIFGPVLAILPYDTEDDAVRIANDSPYGLSGGVWSSDVDVAKRVAQRMRTGQVDINGGRFNPTAPFGGYKQSGNGREYGRFGFDEFLEVKALNF